MVILRVVSGRRSLGYRAAGSRIAFIIWEINERSQWEASGRLSDIRKARHGARRLQLSGGAGALQQAASASISATLIKRFGQTGLDRLDLPL